MPAKDLDVGSEKAGRYSASPASTNRRWDIKAVFGGSQFLLFLAALSIASGVILLLLPIDSYHSFVRIEPFVYLVFLLLFIRKHMIRGAGTIILIVAFFLKLCILPIANFLGDYGTAVASELYLPYWKQACLAIAMEWLVCAASIHFMGKRDYKRSLSARANAKTQLPVRARNNSIYVLVTFVLLLGAVACIAAFSSFRYELYFFWNHDTTNLVSPKNAYYYAFKWALEHGRIMLILYLSARIFQSRRHIGFKVTLLAVLSASIFTEYRFFGPVLAVTIIVAFISANPIRVSLNRRIKRIVALMILVISIFATIQTKEDQTWGNVSRVLDIYWGGYIQAAGTWGIEVTNGITGLFNAIWNQGVLLPNVFGQLHPSTQDFTYDYFIQAGNLGAMGSFYEMSSQTIETVGVLAPVALALPMIFVIWADRRAEVEENLLYRFVYMFVAISTGAFVLMYTYSMIVSHVIYYDMFLLAVVFCDRRFMLFPMSRQSE